MTSQPEELQYSPGTRRRLVRIAVTYLPLAVVTALLALYSLVSFFSGSTGAIIPAILVAVFAIAFAFEGIGAFRDLHSEPVTTTGVVRRTWSRGMLLWFFRSHYVYVENSVFTVAPLTEISVQQGDTVEVEHWPHTNTVIRVRLLRRGSGAMPARPDPTRRTWR